MCQFCKRFFKYLSSGLFFFLSYSLVGGQTLPDSISLALDTIKTSEAKSFYLSELAYEFVHVNMQFAGTLTKMAEKYADESNNAEAMGNSYNISGIIEHTRGNYQEAIKYYYSALRVWEIEKDTAWMAATLNNLGIVYYLIGDYQRSLEQYLRSVSLALILKDSSRLSSVYNNIGIVLDLQQDLDKAYTYYLKGLYFARANNNKDGMATAYNNIGEIFNQKQIFDSALFYYDKSLKINMEIGRTSGIADSYLNFGDVANQMGDFLLAFKYLDIAEDYYLQIGDSVVLIDVQLLRAETYFAQKLYADALKHIDKIIPFAIDLGNLDYLKRIYQLRSQILESKADFKNALIDFKKFKAVVDSVSAQEVQNKLQNFELQYEFDKQKTQFEIQTIKAQNEANLIIATQKRNRNLVLMILLIVVVIAGFLYRMSVIRKRINEELLLKNQQVNEQTEELKQTLHQLSEREQQLMETNKTKDRMFSIIGHDLRGPVGSLQKLLELLTEQFESFSNDELKEMLVTARDSSQQTFNLLENLLLWARAQKDDVVFSPAIFSVNSLVEENVRLLRGTADIKSISIYNIVEDDCIAFCDANSVKTIFRNLISNAVKFTIEGGSIEISCQREMEFILVSVKDNGVGIKKEVLEKLFVFNQIFTTYGTHNEKGTGLGLKLCYDLALLNRGDLSVKSDVNNGSCFTLRLPINNQENER